MSDTIEILDLIEDMARLAEGLRWPKSQRWTLRATALACLVLDYSTEASFEAMREAGGSGPGDHGMLSSMARSEWLLANDMMRDPSWRKAVRGWVEKERAA